MPAEARFILEPLLSGLDRNLAGNLATFAPKTGATCVCSDLPGRRR